MKKLPVPTYFFDFLLALIKDHNIPMTLYLLLNAALGIGILASLAVSFFAVSPGVAFGVGGIVYLLMLIVSYSPLGESMLRYQVGATYIPPEHADRLDPLFEKVLDRARRVNPNLDDRITLFIIEDDTLNAFATGRRTVVLNTGTLSLPNDQLAGILAHEVGHISHKDTDLRMAVLAGNMLVNLAFVAMRFIINIFVWIVSIFSSDGVLALFGMVFSLIGRLFAFILDLAQRLWLFIGKLAMSYSSRKQELRADEFAVNCGAAKGLSRFLSTLLMQQGGRSNTRDILATFMSSHPELRTRLAALANLGVPIEHPELLVE